MTASDKFKIVRRHYLIALICSCVFLVALCQAYPTMTWQLEQLAQAPVLATCVVEETNRDSSVVMASYHSNTVAKLASDGTLLGTFAVGNNPWGVGFDGANIWVTNVGSNTATKLRASHGTLLGTFPVGTQPIGVAFDGANIWVTNFGSNTVSKL